MIKCSELCLHAVTKSVLSVNDEYNWLRDWLEAPSDERRRAQYWRKGTIHPTVQGLDSDGEIASHLLGP